MWKDESSGAILCGSPAEFRAFACERIVHHRDTAQMLSMLCMYGCLQDHTGFHSWQLLHLQQDWSQLKPISGYFNFAPEWSRYGEKHLALFSVVERSPWCLIFLLQICEFCDKPRSPKPHYLFYSYAVVYRCQSTSPYHKGGKRNVN